MKLQIEDGLINEMPCGQNLSYIIEDNAIFFSTEYKVLQSRRGGCFADSMRMSWNGKIQLLYLTGQFRPFSKLLSELRPEGFLTIVSNLFSDIADVRENGFLTCANIDISAEHIFIEPSTLKVKLVYIPSKKRLFNDDASFESALRSELIKIIQEHDNLYSPKTAQLKSNLSNGKVSFQELLSKPAENTDNINASSAFITSGNMKIVALNSPVRTEIEVNKPSFIIGKKPGLADGIVSFNKMISRTHCRIDKGPSGYTVTDLNSSNGTFVNRKRINPGVPMPVKNGDILRLADSDFQIITG